ncbi:MAG: uroporphyrinogen decarboxylase family protein [Christensenellaceae bacterium]
MNSRERIFARINGEKSDRIPNLNILMQFAAREIGVTYSQYTQDYKLLAKGNIVCAQKYGIDCVTTMSDPMREAGDRGTEVVFPPDDVPYPKVDLIQDPQDLLKLKVIQPCDSKRMGDSVRTIEQYKKEVGGELAIIGWVEGCFAEAADLRGVNHFLLDLCDDGSFTKDLLDLCLEQAIVYARAQIEAGADIIGVGDAIASVAGPHMYRDLALGYEIKILKAIKDMGAKTKLHICGNITPFLADIPSEYVDILDVDWMVPLDEAIRLHGDKICISGNYDPVSVLLQGSTADIDKAVRDCAAIGTQKYVSSAGCETPKFTPQENLMQVHKTLIEMQG